MLQPKRPLTQNERYYTIPEAADLLHCTSRRVMGMVLNGTLMRYLHPNDKRKVLISHADIVRANTPVAVPVRKRIARSKERSDANAS